MSNEIKNKRFIISGGGTGGHVYPAISIAQAIKEINPNVEILFVGANGKIEMQKVPQAGFNIEGLDIAGFKRSLSFSNIKVVVLLIKSLFKARKIIKSFKPDAVVGVGGYASGPLGFWANRMNIPLVLQEQNSFAGVTNRILGKGANTICVAYDGMEKFFEKNKIINTGNPIRKKQFSNVQFKEAYAHFNLNPEKPVVVFVGGSLGARAINNVIEDYLKIGLDNIDYQIIWQTGKLYNDRIMASEAKFLNDDRVKILPFIDRMDYLFKVADIIVSRAGAGTISELCLVAKPSILVPSPNVAEDHQTQNAKALVEQNAAIMVKDSDLKKVLFLEIKNLLNNKNKQEDLSAQMAKLAKPDAALDIAKIVLSI